MKNLHDRSYRKAYWKRIFLPVCGSLLILAVLFVGLRVIGNMNKKQNLELLRQTVNRTTVECYAIEGIYPPDVAYMEENYHLNYDHDSYYIFYDCFASNMMPVIEIYEKK